VDTLKNIEAMGVRGFVVRHGGNGAVAELAAHERQFDRASSWFLSLARETSDPRLAQKAFQTAVLADNMDRAQRAVRQWLQLAPDDPNAVASAVSLAANLGKTQGMARTLRGLIEGVEKGQAEKDDGENGEGKGESRSDWAIRQAADIVNRLEDKQAALNVLQDTLAPWLSGASTATASTANLMLADAAWRAGQPQQALQLARQAQQQAPGSEEIAQRNLAYGVQVDASAALTRARAFLQRYPQADRLGVQLAAQLARHGMGDEALHTLARLQQQLPDNVNLLRAEADLNLQMGHVVQAIVALERANRRQPHASDIQYDLGMLYERAGRLADFERMMQAIIDQEPEHANALNALGYTWADHNVRLAEAHVLLERALQLAPDSPHILDSVGWYHYRAGNLAQARHYLEVAYQLMDAADVAAHLGEVMWQLGEREKALTLWRSAREKDAGNDVLRQTMQRYGVQP